MKKTASEKFHGLNGATVSRRKLQRLLAFAKKENDTAIVYRLSKVLRNNPDIQEFSLMIKAYPQTGLNAPRHKGSYKEALDDCGRLRPGFRFKNGAVVKVAKKIRKPAPVKKKYVPKVAPAVVIKKPEAKAEPTPKKETSKVSGSGSNKKPVAKTATIDKKTLEKVNPAPHVVKPKSTSVATAIADVLSTGKYPDIKQMQAQVLYRHFKDMQVEYDEDDEESDFFVYPVKLRSKFDTGVMRGYSKYYDLDEYDDVPELHLAEDGFRLLEAIDKRLESLKNQKHNYAFFEGLKGRKWQSKLGLGRIITEDEFAAQAAKIKKDKGLACPVPEPAIVPAPAARPKSSHPKVMKIGGSGQPSEYFTVAGEVGKFLQRVERKPKESVVITMDGEKGAGKTTTLYHFIEAFAAPGNKCLFMSFEEHPASALAKEKANKYLSPQTSDELDTVAEVASYDELLELILQYDIIFIDSWQKLVRMIRGLRLDEDLRKKVDGKVFVIICQQTTTGTTKGGAEIGFDGDIIIKMVKEDSFSENYAYFDKHRYTLVAIETTQYNIASGKCYNPEEKEDAPEQQQPIQDKTTLKFKVI